MTTKTLEPMAQNSQVQTTTNYSLFKKLHGNRDINKLHLGRLIESMRGSYLYTVIIINELSEVIDGQHRLEAAKTLGLPINYIVVKGYGLREIQIFNANTSDWTTDEYVAGYCDLGYSEYITYQNFKKEFGLNHRHCQYLLANSGSGSQSAFKRGTWKVLDLETAREHAVKLLKVAQHYEGWKRRSFVACMISMFKNADFVFDEFLDKLRQNPSKLTDCAKTEQYKIVVEKIYNYRRSKKINLRF